MHHTTQDINCTIKINEGLVYNLTLELSIGAMAGEIIGGIAVCYVGGFVLDVRVAGARIH